MIGIRTIASYVPANHIDNIGQAEKFGITDVLHMYKLFYMLHAILFTLIHASYITHSD